MDNRCWTPYLGERKAAQNSISLPNMDLYETIFASLTKYFSSCFCVVCLDVKAKV